MGTIGSMCLFSLFGHFRFLIMVTINKKCDRVAVKYENCRLPCYMSQVGQLRFIRSLFRVERKYNWFLFIMYAICQLG